MTHYERVEKPKHIRKQHELYVNNLVGDVKANPRDFYRYINGQKKDSSRYPPLKKRNESGLAESDFKRLVNLLVSLWMCSSKLNIARSLF